MPRQGLRLRLKEGQGDAVRRPPQGLLWEGGL